MKKLLTLLFTLIAVSHFGTTQIFAQKKLKPREVIVIEISVPTFEEPDKREVLINLTSKTKYENGGGRFQKCNDCDESERSLNSFYRFAVRAFRMGKDKATAGFEIEVKNQCKAHKIFAIYRNQQTKVQLNCGVSLIAYYGFESEEAN